MISIIKGSVFHKKKDTLVIDTQSGIGYAVRMSPLSISRYEVGSDVVLFTYLKVSENALELYGFQTEGDRSFFELLLSVKGIGPKSALNILSLGSLDHIQSAIARGDATYLSAVQGMGKKTAERLCVELKNKVVVAQDANTVQLSEGESVVLGEVVDGLVALGYSKEEAQGRIKDVVVQGKTTEQILKEVLTS
jgi:holliday junction DNA helicase RuvA